MAVIRSPFCRVEAEFRAAVARFEEEGADCIVTWHAAYSPSLESIEALARTSLPIVVLDTTGNLRFRPRPGSGRNQLLPRHHGVMDMCNMLKRHGKAYAIAAGHYPSSDVLDRAIGYGKAAVAARALHGSRVGAFGRSFPGMGDFLMADEELAARFGVEVVHAGGAEVAALRAAVSEEDIAAEMAADLEGAEKLNDFSEECHRGTVRDCLAVRRWLELHRADAFTVNFLDISPAMGLDSMPFMEACKAMGARHWLCRRRGYPHRGAGRCSAARL